jgi:hypothetical protein
VLLAIALSLAATTASGSGRWRVRRGGGYRGWRAYMTRVELSAAARAHTGHAPAPLAILLEVR